MNITKQAFVLLALFVIPFASYSQEKKTKTKAPQSIPAIPAGESEEKKAFKEDLQRAMKGDPEAQCAIATIYAGGNTSLGVKVDRNIASSWYLKAANQGYRPVYSKLSMFHALEAVMCKARGASESEEIAEHIKWFLVAQNKEKHRNREWAFGQMSESTKAEGERRAKAFMDEQAKKSQSPAGK